MSESQAKEDIVRRLVGAASPQVGTVRTISGMRENSNMITDGTPITSSVVTPLNAYLQSTEKQAVSFDELLAMSGGVEGRIPGSFAYNQDGIMINYATQLSDPEKAKISDYLIRTGVVSDPVKATEMIGPLAEFKAYELAGETDKAFEVGIELGFMNREDGYDVQKAGKINELANQVSILTNSDALNNMGSLLNVTGVRGDFIPNTGTNTQTAGASFLIDGSLRFNEDQMNQIGEQMGWGKIGNFNDMFKTDVDNIEGVDGRSMFRREEDEKGTPYWYMDAVYKTDFSTSKEAAVYDIRNTETQYGDNDVQLSQASNDVVLMKKIKQGRFSTFSNDIGKIAGLSNTSVVKDVYNDYAKNLIRYTTQLGGTSNDYSQILMMVEKAIIDLTKTNKNPSREEVQQAITQVLPR